VLDSAYSTLFFSLSMNSFTATVGSLSFDMVDDVCSLEVVVSKVI
jgi:hypothetical protein